MTSNQVFKHFGSKAKAADAIGIQRQSINDWGKYPPCLRQLQIEKMTNGELKADKSCFSG